MVVFVNGYLEVHQIGRGLERFTVILLVEGIHFKDQLLGRNYWLLGSVVLLLGLLLVGVVHLRLLHRVVCAILLLLLSIRLLSILLLYWLRVTKVGAGTTGTLVNLLTSPSLLLLYRWRELVCWHWGVLVNEWNQIGQKLRKSRLYRVPMLHICDCEHVLVSDVVKSFHYIKRELHVKVDFGRHIWIVDGDDKFEWIVSLCY